MHEHIVRSIPAAPEFRDINDAESLGLMSGFFARYNEWTEIHSWFEGDFMERVMPGAGKKTMRENRDNIKTLYDHGQDMYIGNKVLGPIRTLEDQPDGGYYEVPLFDTAYNHELLPGLRAGVYGASFRFQVLRDEWDRNAKASDYNPSALPERSIKEYRLAEFGPVTFPAYPNATAGVRSISATDRYYEQLYRNNPAQLEEMRAKAAKLRTLEGDAAEGTSPDSAATDETGAASEHPGSTPGERARVLRELTLNA